MPGSAEIVEQSKSVFVRGSVVHDDKIDRYLHRRGLNGFEEDAPVVEARDDDGDLSLDRLHSSSLRSLKSPAAAFCAPKRNRDPAHTVTFVWMEREGTERKIDQARVDARDELAVEFLDAVDDCDWALDSLAQAASRDDVAAGVEQLRRRLVARFEQLGYTSFAPLDEPFDPECHHALAVVVDPDRDGMVVDVHRRGWRSNGRLVRAATVTVAQDANTGEPQAPSESRKGASPLDRRRRSHAHR